MTDQAPSPQRKFTFFIDNANGNTLLAGREQMSGGAKELSVATASLRCMGCGGRGDVAMRGDVGRWGPEPLSCSGAWDGRSLTSNKQAS
ncbi:MAG: hypothetical protein P4L33_20540 [Capsulimonadaceae bacterium]|nr:hypothetical protein [Capsulimonadaceae bacterium]